MSVEKFISGRKQGEHHFGGHSKRMRLDASFASLRAWKEETELPRVKGLIEIFRYPGNIQADREQRIQAHLGGHSVDSIPESEEISLFFRDAKTQRECES